MSSGGFLTKYVPQSSLTHRFLLIAYCSDGGFLTLPATGTFHFPLYCSQLMKRRLAVLFCYEYAITFDEEVRCVWKRRISGASILFVLNRYVMLLASLASIVKFIPFPVAHFDSPNREAEADLLNNVRVANANPSSELILLRRPQMYETRPLCYSSTTQY